MTGAEIRKQQDSGSPSNSLAPEAIPYMLRDCYFMLREIAAQLADANQLRTLDRYGITAQDITDSKFPRQGHDK